MWNEAAAHRLTTLGHSVRKGDLVWTHDGQSQADDSGETSCAQVTRQMLQILHKDYDSNFLNKIRTFYQNKSLGVYVAKLVDKPVDFTTVKSTLFIFQIHVVTDHEEQTGVFELQHVSGWCK